MSLHSDSSAIRKHLVIAQESAAPTLNAKRCACGKAAFARQLIQHGKCISCQLADRVATLDPEDLDILRFMVGATAHHPRVNWGFRNQYLANRRDLAALDRLIAAGFATAGAQLLQLRYFHATCDGCRVAGLTGKRVDRAMGVRP